MTTERVYAFIVDFRDLYGHSPSYQEIADALGLSGAGAVSPHVDRLERDGRITRKPWKHRGIELREEVESGENQDDQARVLD